MAFLKVFTNGEERTVFLGGDPVVIGRGMETDILLKDQKASREHCVVEPCGKGRWRVLDLHSGNGTKVNGKKIQSRELAPEDVITVGDARILFAGEAVAVVKPDTAPPARVREPREPRDERERKPRRKSYTGAIVIGSVLVVALAALLFLWNRGPSGPRYGAAETNAYRAVRNADGDADLVELARTYLASYRDSKNAPAVERLLSQARDRLRTGGSAKASGFSPSDAVKDLTPRLAIERLETMLERAKPEHRLAIQDLLEDYHGRLTRQRNAFFDDLQAVFREHVEKGEFARAREIWFFLQEDADWVPIPPAYVNRIVQSNRELETAAAAARTRLFEEVAALEAAHDFRAAKTTLAGALPRFSGTSVERSLRERLEFNERALRSGTTTTTPTAVVRADVGRQIEAALAKLGQRDFAGAAADLKALAIAEKGGKTVAARARECEAAAVLHATMVTQLASGKLPSGLVAKKWRVLGADADRLTVKLKGQEIAYAWKEAPAELLVALAARHADKSALGLCVLAHALGGNKALTVGLEYALKHEETRLGIDRFIAARVKNENLPEGGYVVYGGEIVSKKEYHRREEEALIQRFTKQFKDAFAAIKADATIRKLDKLGAAKDELDKARAYAKELIYDEKTYFYPYRGTGREGEYNKVQQEVDRRVDAVRELWVVATPRSIRPSATIQKALKQFREAAKELEKRLVYVEEEVIEVEFLASYFGQKFTVQNFYRSPEEKELLDYGVEVMAFNTTVKGDITEVEREQVRVTNDYRIMFGHQPVRLVEKLVKSSRGHCEEMSKLGYFGHFSPTPGRRTPYDRMKLQGYLYGSSENCIMGQTNPMGAHKGWCHSSGHHRNLLMPGWTEMGTGHYGRYMTQNFGSAMKYSEKDKPDPADTAAESGCGSDDGFDYDDEDK